MVWRLALPAGLAGRPGLAKWEPSKASPGPLQNRIGLLLEIGGLFWVVYNYRIGLGYMRKVLS